MRSKERSAAALADYTRPEPLPFADFYIARARVLAAHGRDRPDKTALGAELDGLRRDGDRLGLLVALPAIDSMKFVKGADEAP